MHMGSKIVHVYVQLYLLVWDSYQVPLKRGRAELHFDTKNKTKCAEMTGDDKVFGCVWLRASLNWGQISNYQTSARGLGPRVGKYQSSYSPESRVFQDHSATTSALWRSKIIYHFSLFYFLRGKWKRRKWKTETESWNGKLKQKAETEKLKFGSGRQKYKHALS